MKKIRLISLFCALSMIVATLGACKPAEPNTDSSGTGDASKTESKTEANPDAPKGEAPTLVWYQIGGEPADLGEATELMNKYTEEKINAKVELRFLDWGVWSDRIKTIVSTGEKYDMMFTNGDWYPAHVNMGAFADLTDLIPTVTPELQKMIPEALWKGAKIKDKIYSVPTYKDSSQTQYWVWDKAMVDKYQIDYQNIKTIDELDPALRKIKAGEGKSFYPFILNKDGWNGFLIKYDNYIEYDDKEAKVQYTNDRPEMIKI